MDEAAALIANGLRKRYGNVMALNGFDLTVAKSTIHGLLGPNGAGKSTAVKALTTLIEVDEGVATVGGHDVRTKPQLVRRSIGLVGQEPAVDEILGGRQNLVMFGRLFGLSRTAARRRADELLAGFRLSEAADRAVSTYSGGMRRRLDIAAGLILSPVVLFLDEPTTGLDPKARNEVWQSVREVAENGTTVLLTTQYLDEADQLASRVSVMNDGRVVAEGSPEELKRRLGGDRVTVTLAHDTSLKQVADLLTRVSGEDVVIDEESRSITIGARAGTAVLLSTVRTLDAAGIVPEDVALRRPTLDEVFLAITDRGAQA